MHIPDNFLSPPVWATLDIAAIPAVALACRRAAAGIDDKQVPLLGVMGAFVFAAQMVNFPVGIGTSGHLVGGALLAFALGPAAASVVLTAIIAVQAFVFQDGGVLALGPNVLNMAFAGVLAGWLPYRLFGRRWTTGAVFSGALLSVMVSASLALSELLVSGVRMPRDVIAVSIALFLVSGVLEGVITVVVVKAIGRLNPGLVRTPAPVPGRRLALLTFAAAVLAVTGFVITSTAPDGLQRLGAELGLKQGQTISAPLADYSIPVFHSEWLRKASAGLAGVGLISIACALGGHLVARRRSA
jgi:cobalt/nickel transport system permease protein